MPITLTVVRGPHAGREFAIDRHDTLLVGRSKDAHLSLPDDPYFSRHHFVIEANPPLCRLTDLNSRNGTLVNGTRVEGAELQDGDEISGGETALRVAVTKTEDAVTLDLPPATLPDASGSLSTLPEAGAIELPGYRQLLEIGRGGMGVVYRAVRNADGAAVAVKTLRPVLAPRPDEVARFLREAEVLGSLAHPRIVRFHESGEVKGLLYLVMDLVTGPDAGRLVRERGPLPVPLAVELVGQLCEALAFAHGKGFVHRDVKPGNILLARVAAGWEVKLGDFGLAKAYQETRMSGLTVSGAAAGTPAFMPPEQVTDFRSAKPAADQYAAAATAYYLLTGGLPFAGASTAEMLRRILAGTLDRVDDRRREVPKGVGDAIHRAMATKPADRFPDVTAFAAALRAAAR